MVAPQLLLGDHDVLGALRVVTREAAPQAQPLSSGFLTPEAYRAASAPQVVAPRVVAREAAPQTQPLSGGFLTPEACHAVSALRVVAPQVSVLSLISS